MVPVDLLYKKEFLYTVQYYTYTERTVWHKALIPYITAIWGQMRLFHTVVRTNHTAKIQIQYELDQNTTSHATRQKKIPATRQGHDNLPKPPLMATQNSDEAFIAINDNQLRRRKVRNTGPPLIRILRHQKREHL